MEEKLITSPVIALLAIAILLLGFVQVQIAGVSGMLTGSHAGKAGTSDLSKVDVTQLQNTAQTLAAVFPVESFASADDAMATMFPTGVPEYGEALGVSFDDPVTALSILSRMQRPLSQEVKASNPEAWQRFVDLASQPRGVSCEYCCGVGPIGADQNGNSRCGCQHNPALLTVAMWLAANTDYTDAEILREVMLWKTLFFPKNMIEMAMNIAGGDASALENLPGMVGGC
ncbi:hypothetical protein J4439_07245 [Candidatus Woesearchaeota archaeon]|nr:hypothetical protein [Candidatus Woesearchaeota archaeon]